MNLSFQDSGPPSRNDSLSDELLEGRDSDMRTKLGIPDGEDLLHSYACAQRGKHGFLWQGVLHLFDQHLVFYSNVFSFVHHVVLDLQDVQAVLPRTYMKFPTAIKIQYSVDGTDNSLLFASFKNRGNALGHIQDQLKKVKRKPPSRSKTLTRWYSITRDDSGTSDAFIEPSFSVLSRLRSSKLEPQGVIQHWKALVEKNRVPADLMSIVSDSLDSYAEEEEEEEEEAHGQDATEGGVECPLEVSREAPLPNVWLPQPGTIPAPQDDWTLLYTEVDLPGTTQDFFRSILSDDTNFMISWWEVKKFKMQQVLAWTPNGTTSIRQVQFLAPLQEAVGPKETLCIQDQHLTVYEDQSLYYETIQNMPQLPMLGGCFHVHMRFDVTASGLKAGKPTCQLKMYLKVVWLRCGFVVNKFKDRVNSRTEEEMRSTCPIMAASMRDYMIAHQASKVDRTTSLLPDNTAPPPSPFTLVHATSRSAPASPRSWDHPLPPLPSAELLAANVAQDLNPSQSSSTTVSTHDAAKLRLRKSSISSSVSSPEKKAHAAHDDTKKTEGRRLGSGAARMGVRVSSGVRSPDRHKPASRAQHGVHHGVRKGNEHGNGSAHDSSQRLPLHPGTQTSTKTSLSVSGSQEAKVTSSPQQSAAEAGSGAGTGTPNGIHHAPPAVALNGAVEMAATEKVVDRDGSLKEAEVDYEKVVPRPLPSQWLHYGVLLVLLLLLLCNVWLLARLSHQQSANNRLMEQLVLQMGTLTSLSSSCDGVVGVADGDPYFTE